MTVTAVSLFSGCGGFDWGAQLAGVNILWANDIDRDAAAAYRSLFPDVEFSHGDIKDIAVFPEADILIGCYPCTGFSVAARRRWHDRKTRDLKQTKGNFLYLEFLRALKIVKPKFFFVENVSGMLSALDGWFFKEQLKGFEDAGYIPEPKLLRAVDYGAPQERKRIFIVGIREDIASQFSYTFPEPTHGPGRSADYVTLRQAIGEMEPWPEGEFSSEPFHGHYLTRNRKRGWDQPSYTIVANASHVVLHPMGDPMRFVSKDCWELVGDENRRLSWKECRRIQCLPDALDFDGTLNAKYKVVGNAVPPVFAKALLKPAVQYLTQSHG